MNICRYEPDMVRELAAIYNSAIRHVPHCYRVSERDFGQALAPALDEKPDEHRHSERVFVACDKDGIVGFTHLAVGRPKRRDTNEAGLIRFIWYRPGWRGAGADLIKAAEGYLAEQGMSTVVAYPQKHIYWFYHLGPAYLSDHLGHVEALLGLHGYRRAAGEVFLNWRNFEVSEPVEQITGVEFGVEQRQESGRRPRIVVRAFRGEERIGVCVSASASQYSRAHPAQEWLFTEWLGVEEEFQGRRLGKSLLQRALWEGRRLGYRHAAISAAWDNYRAILFYSNTGYRVVDWTYGLRKEMQAP